jgi:subtilisin family serine protease
MRALKVVGAEATVVSPSRLAPDFVVLELPGKTLDLTDRSRAFAVAYALADELEAAGAEPDVPTPFFPVQPEPARGLLEEGGIRVPGCWVSEEPALDGRWRWAIEKIRAPEAWAFSEAAGRPSRGAGIVVAQPDTGITKHEELAAVEAVAPRDVLDRDEDPTDRLLSGNKGHGTGTASVLLSPETGKVAGCAPAATHMPIRAVQSVVRVRQVTVATAIHWAVDHRADVITMSLGGIPTRALCEAVRRAVDEGVIVLAAAGNCVRQVVWPARYGECIAVAGTNSQDEKWPGTCRGAAVDISAPGQNVWRARVVEGTERADEVGQGQGTSFAVALTAGVAALWLAHHGRDEVRAAAKEQGETPQSLFLRLLRATARRPEGWDSFDMGAGIVDALALLQADFDEGRGTEAASAGVRPTPEATVESLAVETLGLTAPTAVDLDYRRYGAELAAVLLDRELPGPHPESALPDLSPQLLAALAPTPMAAPLGLSAVTDRGGT